MMDDSGKRQEFDSGAVRDTAENKPRIDLISPYAQWRCGEWLRLGAEKYTERNWEQGIPFGRCMASLERHVQEYKMGKTNEDHLAAIIVNAQFIMHYEKMIELGKLPASLNDLPQYEKSFICPAGWKIMSSSKLGWWITFSLSQYLRKDGHLHYSGTGFDTHKHGEAPGYWPTKEAAEKALAAYLEKEKSSTIGYCGHCEAKIRRAKNGTAVGLCRECSKL